MEKQEFPVKNLTPKIKKSEHPFVLNISRMDWQYMFV